ncbi:hypothetical protein CGLO_14047 [Colletotrichum gloeosporioides Cg-14]|uniref:Uncharacterized protein n=1 Tax=Colletotrichum gloeosporioides (strain Cg-14) TaxID=1237896 RepID=T0JV34_COLGC|nr:hypothetical protein CGLO_14047 [Colletotrichum gloeosporioides Cg-14]
MSPLPFWQFQLYAPQF